MTRFGLECVQVYKCLHKMAPRYLSTLCQPVSNVHGRRLAFNSPDGGVPWDDLHKIFRGCQWMAKVPNGVEKLPPKPELLISLAL